MRNIAIGLVILLVSILPAAAEMMPGQAMVIPHPSLSVSGQGTVEVAPDTVRVTASVITEGETVELARERNAQIVQRAMAGVKALQLKEVSTKTLDYTMARVTRDANVRLKVDPEKIDIPWKVAGANIADSNFTVEVPITLGYSASNSLTVRVQSASREDLSSAAGKIVDALMAAGTNQITSVVYSLEKDDNIATREALAKAVKNAQLTAEAVSAAAGRKIVGIRSINPSYFRPESYRNVQVQGALRNTGGGGSTDTSLTAGMIQVTAQVSINYDLDYNPGDTKILGEPAGQ
jgi:uncharacterized protein